MPKLLGVAFLLAVLTALPFLIWGEGMEALFAGEGARERLSAYGDYAWAAGVGLLIADLVVPVPTTAVMAGLGMIYGPAAGGLIATLGSILAGVAGYAAGRWLGRPAVSALAGEETTRRGEVLFAASGGWIVALSRWLPILPEVVSCVAGISRMRFSAFVLALGAGSAPLGFAFATVGRLGVEAPLITLLFSAAAPLLLWPLAQRLLASPRDERD